MSYIIKTDNITKDFGDFRAVNSINLKVPRNSVYGVLGPNGAGKSTLISMLCTILSPTSGTAKINGYDIIKEANDVRRSIGIVFQTRALDDILTGREHLEMHAALYGVPKDVREDRIDEVLDLIALGKKADEETKNYSGGMKRRLEIGRGLIHHPKLLFLDEPTLGLDIQTRESIWEYIENLKNNIDITILLTTHYLEEVDNLCDDLSIIDQGEIIKSGNPKELKAELKSDTITLFSQEPKKLCDIMQNQPFVKDIIKTEDEIRLLVEKGEDLIPEVVKIADNNNIKINSIELKHPSLEEVFIKYTGRKIGDRVKK
ncbi:Daunorubicin/doxorubicin resistance ATP-binding protein DrrA [bioreactor metagenome]|uniref:Daunorubicin/doxorubicin resistance ATP-binding protein DrrA n=1 Tax=bioreactor metagenome TaxID=1076179 RepID=A0A644STR1_9ZZZZ|nr:ATP-binding cassette domain-containing protein [Methanobrevibacter sp.]MEA4956231.1 ATP-binding cassette domain-containing protein [Methanobrevibacter sp.]